MVCRSFGTLAKRNLTLRLLVPNTCFTTFSIGLLENGWEVENGIEAKPRYHVLFSVEHFPSRGDLLNANRKVAERGGVDTQTWVSCLRKKDQIGQTDGHFAVQQSRQILVFQSNVLTCACLSTNLHPLQAPRLRALRSFFRQTAGHTSLRSPLSARLSDAPYTYRERMCRSETAASPSSRSMLFRRVGSGGRSG